MSDTDLNPDELFPEWQRLFRSDLTEASAVKRFKEMARQASGPDDLDPVLPAKDYRSPGENKPIRIRLDLREPDGDHDHCLYKSKDDSRSRRYAGLRRSQDFQADRADRIDFLPVVLLRPRFVYSDPADIGSRIYVERTGRKEWYLVVVRERERGEPRFRFVTAYPIDSSSFDRKRKAWKRLFARKQE